MNLKKKLWRLLSVLSTLLLVILPISGCDYSFSAESNTETGTYTTLSETTDSTSDSATEQNKTSNIESGNTSTTDKKQIDETDGYLDKDGSYTSKEDVMNYLIEYGQLPNNFITKKEAKKLGWSGGSLGTLRPRQMYWRRLFLATTKKFSLLFPAELTTNVILIRSTPKAVVPNESFTLMTGRFTTQTITINLSLYFMGMMYNDNYNRWFSHEKERRFLSEHKRGT